MHGKPMAGVWRCPRVRVPSLKFSEVPPAGPVKSSCWPALGIQKGGMSLRICRSNLFPGGVDAGVGPPKQHRASATLKQRRYPCGHSHGQIDRKVSDATFWVQGRAVQSQLPFPWEASNICSLEQFLGSTQLPL